MSLQWDVAAVGCCCVGLDVATVGVITGLAQLGVTLVEASHLRWK